MIPLGHRFDPFLQWGAHGTQLPGQAASAYARNTTVTLLRHRLQCRRPAPVMHESATESIGFYSTAATFSHNQSMRSSAIPATLMRPLPTR